MLKGTVDKYNISSVRADAAYDKAIVFSKINDSALTYKLAAFRG